LVVLDLFTQRGRGLEAMMRWQRRGLPPVLGLLNHDSELGGWDLRVEDATVEPAALAAMLEALAHRRRRARPTTGAFRIKSR
jgi:hypothetical protein